STGRPRRTHSPGTPYRLVWPVRRPDERVRQPGPAIPLGRVDLELGQEQAGREVGTAHVSGPEIGADEVGRAQVGTTQVGADEVRAPQVRTPEIGAREPPPDEVGAPEILAPAPNQLARPQQQAVHLLAV